MQRKYIIIYSANYLTLFFKKAGVFVQTSAFLVQNYSNVIRIYNLMSVPYWMF